MATEVLIARPTSDPPPEDDPTRYLHQPVFAYEHEGVFFVGNLRSGPSKFMSVDQHEATASLREWLQTRWHPPWRGGIAIEPHPLSPGEFFPRMWRPGWKPPLAALESGALRSSCVAADSILSQLRALFQVIEPAERTHDVYGHDIRNLLLLACTEIENAWKGILTANGCQEPRCTTRNYVSLLEPLALDTYELRLIWYPEYPVIRPFEHWSVDQPTPSLEWYDAYNKVKHDRDTNFGCATLRNAIQAVAGLAVMLVAQFGPQSGYGYLGRGETRVRLPDDDIYASHESPDDYHRLDGLWGSGVQRLFDVSGPSFDGLSDDEFLVPPPFTAWEWTPTPNPGLVR